MSVPTRPAALRIELDPDAVGRGLSELVLVVLEILRELLERQALRRLDAGELTPAEVERVGAALRDAADQLSELRHAVATPARRPAEGSRT